MLTACPIYKTTDYYQFSLILKFFTKNLYILLFSEHIFFGMTTLDDFILRRCFATLGSGVVGVSALDLFDHDPEMGLRLFLGQRQTPSSTLMELEQAVLCAQIKENLFEVNAAKAAKVSLYELPLIPAFSRFVVPDAQDVNTFLSFTGTVVRTGPLLSAELSREFECVVCKSRQRVQADDWQFGRIEKPLACTSRDPEGTRCRSTKFRPVPIAAAGFLCQDVQAVKVQELTEEIGMGRVPRSLTVQLKGPLVDACQPGNRVTVTGVLIARWKPTKLNSPIDTQLTLLATHVQHPLVNSTGPEQLCGDYQEEFWRQSNGVRLPSQRQKLVDAFCPDLYGLDIVKFALLLALISGSSDQHRKNIHVLLAGDPGTGKSRLLHAAAQLVPRAVCTTGSGSSTVGLTAAAVKEAGSEWSLEPGALPMADGGICCIDEFLALKPADRTSIHEAMEQQTISVAKAGMVCKLRTRCSVLAACNGIGDEEAGEDRVSGQSTLASPLLSRFDLVLALNTRADASWDERLSSALLGMTMRNRAAAASDGAVNLKAYICAVRGLNPRLTGAAQQLLARYYERQRGLDVRNAARTTARLLESLMRLGEAHAKLMGRSQYALLEDAAWALWLMDSSLPNQCVITGAKANLLTGTIPNEEDILAMVTRPLGISLPVFKDMEREEVEAGVRPRHALEFQSSQAAAISSEFR